MKIGLTIARARTYADRLVTERARHIYDYRDSRNIHSVEPPVASAAAASRPATSWRGFTSGATCRWQSTRASRLSGARSRSPGTSAPPASGWCPPKAQRRSEAAPDRPITKRKPCRAAVGLP